MAVFSGNGSATSPSFTFSSDTNTGMYRNGANELAFTTNGGRRVLITNTGTGIGTTNIDYQLSVGGGAIGVGAGSTAAIYFDGAIGGNTVGPAASINSVYTSFGTNSNADLFFTTNNSFVGNPNERVRIRNNGALQVGGTLPSAPNAEIQASGSYRYVGRPLPLGRRFVQYPAYGYAGQTFDVAAAIAASIPTGTWSQAIVTVRGSDSLSFGYWHGIYSYYGGRVYATELASSGGVTLTVSGGQLVWPAGLGTGQWYNTTVTITVTYA